MLEVPVELLGLLLGLVALADAAIVRPLERGDGPSLRDDLEGVVTGLEGLVRAREAEGHAQRMLL
eukprot:6919324-Alexandrium_andersonii.AAC.1